ncbi:anthranilate synthase component I family protein [Flavobacterium sp. 20NA77.7]|uniref:Anthranilate synthase component I family protein n=1 Tax=Flavobacterium nakdongensis TaxID=3073563 RepID=A0ABY9REG3_9FLAO|nr:anthranilate synthase component I family protein [Flavobacterium sp. 20NA77.7]WMW78700.1 anthranilate synthase component I family protein [Flavobacterium sp. 20NA77.7]
MRYSVSKYIQNVAVFKKQLMHWANQFDTCICLDSNREQNLNQLYASYDLVVAVDAFTSIQTDYEKAFEELHIYQSITKDWLFGYLSYDLKNDIEELASTNFDGLQFPELFFFQPKKIFLVKGNEVEMLYLNMCDDELESDFEEISNFQTDSLMDKNNTSLEIKPRISKDVYLEKTAKMLQYIQEGKVYEANYCMEFYAEKATINPLAVYYKLNEISFPPFAVYFKKHQHFVASASPERYVKKKGTKIISQPIKGTAKRSTNVEEDERLKENLSKNSKECSENIMIVDLVRNDLSQTATKGSVVVEELCKVFTYKQVHQMISTIVSEVSSQTAPVEILRTTFPMGSMTGAPKIAAMQFIEELEENKRGLYSGAIGYFTPKGNFDFNVVIRSILYNANNQYLSFSVGSAITSQAIPEMEYEECMLKAKALFEVLN